MKNIFKYACFLTVIIFILSGSSFSFASSKGIKWYTYKQGIDLSKIEGERYFYTFMLTGALTAKKWRKKHSMTIQLFHI